MSTSTPRATTVLARHVPRPVRLAVGLAVILALVTAAVAGVRQATADLQPSATPQFCASRDLDVSLTDQPGSAQYRIRGWLCQARRSATTVQLLVPGLTYAHTYWTGANRRSSFDYVTAAMRAGTAVYVFDRIGTGGSDRPPADQVTLTAHAVTLHQINQALRDGRLGRYRQVIGIGHSYGSMILQTAAATYQDLDRLVLTGRLHDVRPDATANIRADLYPATQDPQLATSNPPNGYLTTRPGTRAAHFLNPGTALPGAHTWDENSKATATTGELAMNSDGQLRHTQAIRVPVLLVVGTNDALFCGAQQPCASPASICHRELPAYPAAQLSAVTVTATGHSINLHRTAPQAAALTAAWLNHAPHATMPTAALASCVG